MISENKLESDGMTPYDDLIPVTLLCGFLGAGKTTLLKHILETKHSEENFKCAVIVNDMASLNIDKKLIDQSALVQSDEVIAMQNGCFCCTLQNNLVDQIIDLAQKRMFNYMLIEASGVSEPSQIAPLFDLCEDDHDHEAEHKEGSELGELARLDTCVTVVDAVEFYNNFEGMKNYNDGTIAELMMEQVEFSNVVVLNKQDLVTESQINDIIDRISLINSKAKILRSSQSKINVMEILNTRLYTKTIQKPSLEFDSSNKVSNFLEDFQSSNIELFCCKTSLDNDGKICCESESKNISDTGLSFVQLGSSPTKSRSQMTRHEKRFGITSFLYHSRRPFHPHRLYHSFIKQFFMPSSMKTDDDENDSLKQDDTFNGNIESDNDQITQEDGEIVLKEKQKERKIKRLRRKRQKNIRKIKLKEDEQNFEKVQKQAQLKQGKRKLLMGELLRSKGFIWIATSNKYIAGWQQAGNIYKVEVAGMWMERNGDTKSNTTKNVNMGDKTLSFPYECQRQELVFIGINLKHRAMQTVLDQCLLTDEEMKMNPDEWNNFMDTEDKIQSALPLQLLVPPEDIIDIDIDKILEDL